MKIRKEISKVLDEIWLSVKRNIVNSKDSVITLDYDEKEKTTLIKVLLFDDEVL